MSTPRITRPCACDDRRVLPHVVGVGTLDLCYNDEDVTMPTKLRRVGVPCCDAGQPLLGDVSRQTLFAPKALSTKDFHPGMRDATSDVSVVG